jgi:hypothetical protein
MKFRTEIEPLKSDTTISHESNLLMLGSCFTDSIGGKLEMDGFNVIHNPLGALYNPASLAACIGKAIAGYTYSDSDLCHDGTTWHCLDYASRYSSTDVGKLVSMLNADMAEVITRVRDCDTLIITFGTAWVFEDVQTSLIVGNCHKLPASKFMRCRLSCDDIVNIWRKIIVALPNKRILFTVSPIRHVADGLHGNNVSKATLLLAVEQLCSEFDNCEYFPSYEIVIDDLRDYRFYAADMKHPSDTAVDYIYDIFANTYFTTKTKALALENRKIALRAAHRQIL